MHNLLSGARAGLALVALWTLAAVGCKAKVDSSPADGGAKQVRVDRLVNAHLTDHASNMKLPSGETLIAVDRVRQVRFKANGKHGATVTGRARVFVRTASGEDIRRSLRLQCELARKKAAWAVDACHLDGRIVHPGSVRPSGSNPPNLGEWSVGIPACDRYMRVMQCYTTKMPAAAQAATKKAIRQSLKAFRKMAMNPATRPSLVKTCKMAIKALRKGIAKMPKFRDCLQ